jgi:glycosyltransferase involved in cell wall biosynthesis
MDGTKRSQLSFVGNGANPTNKEAMAWFLDSIFHLIREKYSDMKLIIIGADWEYLIAKYPQYEDALVIRGLLSQEDMTSALLTSKVFVSPIVASTGLNTKNLLALSRGLPMVTTPDGSHGLMYWPEDGSYTDKFPPFYITKSAKEFAEKVLELYENNELWQEVCQISLSHFFALPHHLTLGTFFHFDRLRLPP